MNYIFDIDGTLMNIDHRRHYVEGDKKDWKSFVDNIKHDTPNYPVVETMLLLAENASSHRCNFYFLTGRNESQRWETVDQLKDQCRLDDDLISRMFGEKNDYTRILGLWEEILLMRPDGDYRPDAELKSELFDKLVDIHGFDIEDTIIFDDRQAVVDMWRARGLTCFQVAKGDF